MPVHPTHKTRFSMDASTFDEICVLCGATDQVPGGYGQLAFPCPKQETSEQESTSKTVEPVNNQRNSHMLALTLSSYNDNDGNIDELIGVFASMEEIVDSIVNERGESNRECAKFVPAKKPERKSGMMQKFISVGYVDNGWGGRYYSVWEIS